MRTQNSNPQYSKIRQILLQLIKPVKKRIIFLGVAGSFVRGDATPGWSDLDLYVVVNGLDVHLFQKFYEIKQKFEQQTSIRLEYNFIDKRNFLYPPRFLHDKIRDFFYFINHADILINHLDQTPKISITDYRFCMPFLVCERQRAFYKRNFIDLNDAKAVRKACGFTITYIKLILKKTIASISTVPESYSEILHFLKKRYPNFKYDTLYSIFARRKQLTTMPENELKSYYCEVVQFFDYCYFFCLALLNKEEIL